MTLFVVTNCGQLPKSSQKSTLQSRAIADVKSVQENSLFLKPMVPNDQVQDVPSSSPYGEFMAKSFQGSLIDSYMVHDPFNYGLFKIKSCLLSSNRAYG